MTFAAPRAAKETRAVAATLRGDYRDGIWLSPFLC